ncbi:MAG TPA: restriction endonuclease subunit S [Thermoanaerobaculaceae bacterium]|nr:restriction endonuclease subunit S [Thermoanaerobaculaceae bacterium]HPS77940.1 restriction endonuclease subunit S [Thermoanaerobaculaceae bacterium]
MSKQWPLVRLGEVLRLVNTSVPAMQLSEVELAGVYSFARGLFKRGPMSPAETSYKTFNRLVTDDFVISQPKAWEGAVARVTPEFEGWFLSPVFPTFRAEQSRLRPDFLEWYCKQSRVWGELQQRSRGIGARRETVSAEQFLSLEVPLPSVDEQRRIVARIEELAAHITEARSLRRLAGHDSEALVGASLRDIFASCPDDAEVVLGAACKTIIDNLHSNPRYADSGVPCVRSPDVGWGRLDLATALKTDETEYRRRTARGEPQADDVVLVREGGGTGKCALVLPGQRFSLGQRVMMLRPNLQQVDPRFFLYQLLSPQVQEDQIAPRTKGSASPHLNIGSLRRFRFRLPPLPEQRRIVAELDALQAQVDALTRLQAESAAELDALLPSILDAAFKGEL